MTKAKKKETSSKVILKKDGKMTFIYIKDCVFYYASLTKPKEKFKSDNEKEYTLTAFIDESTKDELLELDVNKTFFEVGVDKITKGKRKGQVKYDVEKYPECEGLFGFTVTAPEFNKAGNKTKLQVVDVKGKPLKELIGNGSKGNLKTLAWLNADEEYCFRLNLVHVTDLVAYEQDGEVVDDELGITYEIGSSDKSKDADLDDELEDDDHPFGDDDDTDDDEY